MKEEVTPYEVKGNIDYEKLIKKFGVKKITPDVLKEIESITGEIHPYLRRGIFFAYRDLKEVLTEYKKGKKFFYTLVEHRQVRFT